MSKSAARLFRLCVPGLLLLISIFTGCVPLSRSVVMDMEQRNTFEDRLDTDYFFSYRSLIDSVCHLPPSAEMPPAVSYVLGEYAYLHGDYDGAAAYLLRVLESDDDLLRMSALGIIRDMYLDAYAVGRIVTVDQQTGSSAADTALLLERLNWATATGRLELAAELYRRSGALNAFTAFPSPRMTGYHSVRAVEKTERLYMEKTLPLPETARQYRRSGSEYSIGFDHLADAGRSSGIYLYTSFTIKEPGRYRLLADIGAPWKLYMDGSAVFSRGTESSGGVFTENIVCDLSAGTHSMLLKVTPWKQSDVSVSLFLRSMSSGVRVVFSPEVRQHTGTVRYAAVEDQNSTDEESASDRNLFRRYIAVRSDELLYGTATIDRMRDLYSLVPASISPGVLFMLARGFSEDDPDRARRLLSFLSDEYPSLLTPQAMLADMLTTAEEYSEAAEVLENMDRHGTPQTELLVGLKKADLYYFREWIRPGLALERKLIDRYPAVPAVVFYAANGLESLGDIRSAMQIKEQLLDEFPYYMPLLSELQKDYDRTGDIPALISVLERQLMVRPDDIFLQKALGFAWFRLRDHERALPYLETAYRAGLSDGELMTRLADTYSFLGRSDAALKVLRDADRRLPGSRAVTSRMAMYRAGNTGQLLSRQMLDDATVLEKAARVRSDPPQEGNSVVVLDECAQMVYYSGNIYSRSRLVVLLKNREAVRTHTSLDVKGARVVDARIIKADGTVSDRWDADTETIRFYGLAPGDTVSYTTEVVYEHGNWLNGFDFSWLFSLEGTPVAHSILTVLMPVDMEMRFHVSRGVTRRDGRSGQYSAVTFEKHDSFFPAEQPPMRPVSDFLPRVSYSAVNSWDDFSRWFSAFIHEQTRESKAVRRTVARLVSNAENPDDMVRALRNYIARDLSYLFDDAGVYKVKPGRTDRTFFRRAGDCKDKALLLRQMLSIVGIKSRYALVRTRNAGKLIDDLPFMQFDHALVHIPAQKGIETGYFVDPTSRYDNYRGINPALEGLSSFVVFDRTGKWQFIPVSSGRDARMNISFSASGNRVRMSFHGAAASYARYRNADDGSLTSWLSEIINGVSALPVTVKTVEIAGDVFDEPLQVITSLERFFPVPVSHSLSSAVERTERFYPLLLYRRIGHYTFSFPCDDSAVSPFREENPYFLYEIGRENGLCTVNFSLRRREISPEAYKDFRERVIRVIAIENKYRGMI